MKVQVNYKNQLYVVKYSSWFLLESFKFQVASNRLTKSLIHFYRVSYQASAEKYCSRQLNYPRVSARARVHFTYSIAFPYYEDKSNEKQNIRFQYYPLKVPLELGYTNHCFSVCSRQLFSITLYATMTILINHSTKQLTELKLTLILR